MSLDNQIMDALNYMEENDVKFIRLQFCDLFGQSRNIAISSHQIERALTSGILFDASSVIGFLDEKNSDLVLFPDMSTIQILPWRPQQGRVARILCDIKYPNGEDFMGDSRKILKKSIEKVAALGYEFNIGAECEFYLFKLDENGEPTTEPIDSAGYFDLAPYDRGENTRREICLTLEDMNFEIESSHHESGKGQHEIDFKYDNALISADNIMTFKTVVKTIAQRNGLHASFLPKPMMEEPGSGMHINISLIESGENIFNWQDGYLSEKAQQFIAGILAHIKGITAIANPLVNSYKRLMGGKEAPQNIGWGFSNRAPLIRIPAAEETYARIELRSPDSACNPYLVFALVLAAGLDGIERQLELSKEYDLDEKFDLLPMTLDEGIREMKKDDLIHRVLGEELTCKYIALKTEEWKHYIKTVHPWEIENYFLSY
ncbi:MAG: type I glutamate--ammonia ligase [Eubacteriaceae bacterium]